MKRVSFNINFEKGIREKCSRALTTFIFQRIYWLAIKELSN
jgi:hypothetical protein